jgi:hypothetical protein
MEIKQRNGKDNSPMLKSLFARRPLWIGAAAALVLALSFSFAPVRLWAGQFLGLFRVQQIEVLPIDVARLESLTGDSTLADQISRLFADSVNITQEPGPEIEVATAGEASSLAGFTVRLLGGDQREPRLTVKPGGAFDVVVDRELAQALLNDAGRSDLQLPASIDGATISVAIPAGVTAAYGDCPQLREGEGSFDPDDSPSAWDCVLLAQIPSPSINTPPDLDMAQLADIGLQLAGMNRDEAAEFSRTVDWTSTLVVPIPQGAASYETATVDGVEGTVVYGSRFSRGPELAYTVMWVKDGIIYALSGFGTPEEAVALANTVQ